MRRDIERKSLHLFDISFVIRFASGSGVQAPPFTTGELPSQANSLVAILLNRLSMWVWKRICYLQLIWAVPSKEASWQSGF